jgi:hypothetical protein
VIPAPGLTVRNPETKLLLPPEGIDVPDDSYLWNRILNDGDVQIAKDNEPPPEAETPPAELTPPHDPLQGGEQE